MTGLGIAVAVVLLLCCALLFVPFRWRPVGLYLAAGKSLASGYVPFIAALGMALAAVGAVFGSWWIAVPAGAAAVGALVVMVRVGIARVKDQNVRRNPRVTLLCYDPRQPLRYLEIRGRVIDITESGAAEHLDGLASKYAGRPARFFGDSVPARFAATEIPVIFRIRPIRVVAVDATGTRSVS